MSFDGAFIPIDVTARAPCQRWRARRASYRPAGEPIDARRYGVELIERYTTARVGVTLSRLVLLDDVPANGESWFVARALRLLRAEKPDVGAVVSYSDPVVRTTLDGARVMPGHVGTVYQALNAMHVGRSRKETVILDRDGVVVDRRGIMSKLRNDEQGAAYAYARLTAAGAPPRRPLEGGVAYVERALREGPFRRFRHPGNHTYVWTLHDDVVVKLEAKPYPKIDPELRA